MAFKHLTERHSEAAQELERAEWRRVHLADPVWRGSEGNGQHVEDGQWCCSVSYTCSRRDLWKSRGLGDSVRLWLTFHCGMLGRRSRGSGCEVVVFRCKHRMTDSSDEEELQDRRDRYTKKNVQMNLTSLKLDLNSTWFNIMD